MTDTAPAPAVEDTEGADDARYGSTRGKFEIFRKPALPQAATPEALAEVDFAPIARSAFGYDDLVEGDDDTRATEVVGEMIRATVPGNHTTTIFDQGGPDGMSLVHAWFAPDFPLFRHSHPALGDCLYYVLAGSLTMGRQTLGPGDGFFTPGEMPYRYKAGPEGVEVLEFRAGGGVAGAAFLRLMEKDLGAVEALTAEMRANHDAWRDAPKAPGGGALYEPNA